MADPVTDKASKRPNSSVDPLEVIFRLSQDPSLSDGAFRTYCRLCHHRKYQWIANPSIAQLCEETGKKERTVGTYLAELRSRDLVRVKRQGNGKPNTYVLTDFIPHAKAAKERKQEIDPQVSADHDRRNSADLYRVYDVKEKQALSSKREPASPMESSVIDRQNSATTDEAAYPTLASVPSDDPLRQLLNRRFLPSSRRVSAFVLHPPEGVSHDAAYLATIYHKNRLGQQDEGLLVANAYAFILQGKLNDPLVKQQLEQDIRNRKAKFEKSKAYAVNPASLELQVFQRYFNESGNEHA